MAIWTAAALGRTNYFNEASLRSGLASKAARGILHTGIAQAITIGIGLVAIPVLAKLLDDDDFGLVAMATVLSTIARMVMAGGLGIATLQKSDLTHEQASNLFWINVVVGAAIAAGMVVTSPLVGWVYGEPRVTPIMAVVGSTFLISCLTGQPQSLLQRAMRFDLLMWLNVLTAVVTQVVSIGLAYRWRESEHAYWVLVLGPLTGQLIHLVGVWFFCGWRPSWYRRGVGTRALVSFGANLTAFQLINYLARSVDKFLIGWWWGPASLGAYSMAYRLFLTPLRTINQPATGVVLPSLSRLSNEPGKYREYYSCVVTALTMVTAPICAMIGINADLIVELVFDEEWVGVGPIVQALCVVGVVQCLSNTFGWLYTSQARAQEALGTAAVVSPIHIASFALGLPWGNVGVACSYAIAGLFLTFPYALWRVGRAGPVRHRQLIGLLIPTVVLAASTACGSLLARLAMDADSHGLVFMLSISALAAVASAATAVAVLIGLGSMPSLHLILQRLRPGGAQAQSSDASA